MKNPKKLFAIVSIILLYSCSSTDENGEKDRAIDPKIHIALSAQIGSNVFPQLWNDGAIDNLPSSSVSALATGMSSYKNDIYVCGYLQDAGTKAAYWKNNTLVELSGTNSSASDIYADENGVYVAGKIADGAHSVATYWKNGTPLSLSDGTHDAFANALVVSGSNVYVVGYEYSGTGYAAKLWKNGIGTTLGTGNQDALAYDVSVSGDDVYVVGLEYNGTHYVAKLWKNGLPTDLTDGSSNARANCIFIDGTDIYVGGNNNGKPQYWLNGTAHELGITLGNNAEDVNDICVYDKIVYTAGYTDNGTKQIAKYWNDGVPEIIGVDSNSGSVAFGITIN